MEITWLGHSCFRIRGREAVVLTDPCDQSTGYHIGRPSADIVTVSHDHPGHSHVAAVPGSPRVLRGPGEYEIANVLITGIRTYHDRQRGARLGTNIVYVIEMEDLRICHLGDLGHVPTSEQAEEMGGVDILLTPVGGGSTLDATSASETVSLLEPRLVIPMHYGTPAAKATLDPLDRFLKEMGAGSPESMLKLAVSPSSLSHETRVVVLDYRGQAGR